MNPPIVTRLTSWTDLSQPLDFERISTREKNMQRAKAGTWVEKHAGNPSVASSDGE
jgi:hypothetical protein